MDLLNIIASPFRGLIYRFTKPKPVPESISFGQHLAWEKLAKRNLLEEQQQSKRQ